jgi:mRNA interferase MazF
MVEFGSIVLTHFPFTDLTGTKLRPALVISRGNERRHDIVLAFITSNLNTQNADSLRLEPSRSNGLKAPSLVRFDKIVTLEKRVIVGELGRVDAEFLNQAAPVFFGVFGFYDYSGPTPVPTR